MTITHKLTQHYAVTTPPRYLTTGNACKSIFILIIPFPLTAPIGRKSRNFYTPPVYLAPLQGVTP